MRNEISYFIKPQIKTLSQLRDSMIRTFTHGDVFRWHGEANENELIAQSRSRAEKTAVEMIQRNIEHIPVRIKRDI